MHSGPDTQQLISNHLISKGILISPSPSIRLISTLQLEQITSFPTSATNLQWIISLSASPCPHMASQGLHLKQGSKTTAWGLPLCVQHRQLIIFKVLNRWKNTNMETLEINYILSQYWCLWTKFTAKLDHLWVVWCYTNSSPQSQIIHSGSL
jgi:hypothetical protein